MGTPPLPPLRPYLISDSVVSGRLEMYESIQAAEVSWAYGIANTGVTENTLSWETAAKWFFEDK